MGQYLKIMVFADRVEIPSGRVGQGLSDRVGWSGESKDRAGWNPLRQTWMERKILRQERKNTKKAGPAPSDERTVCLLCCCYVASSYRRYCEEMLLLSTTRRMVSAKRSATESCFTLEQRSV